MLWAITSYFNPQRYRSRRENYSEFRRRLRRLGFDPYRDVAADGGGWRWSSDKPELHAYVREYFAGRREDG